MYPGRDGGNVAEHIACIAMKAKALLSLATAWPSQLCPLADMTSGQRRKLDNLANNLKPCGHLHACMLRHLTAPTATILQQVARSCATCHAKRAMFTQLSVMCRVLAVSLPFCMAGTSEAATAQSATIPAPAYRCGPGNSFPAAGQQSLAGSSIIEMHSQELGCPICTRGHIEPRGRAVACNC